MGLFRDHEPIILGARDGVGSEGWRSGESTRFPTSLAQVQIPIRPGIR